MSTRVYIVIAHESVGSTDPDSLYGSTQLVFATHGEAVEVAADLESSDCWGPDGDKYPEEVGISYEVESADADSLESLWRVQAVEYGLVEPYTPDCDECGVQIRSAASMTAPVEYRTGPGEWTRAGLQHADLGSAPLGVLAEWIVGDGGDECPSCLGLDGDGDEVAP